MTFHLIACVVMVVTAVAIMSGIIVMPRDPQIAILGGIFFNAAIGFAILWKLEQ